MRLPDFELPFEIPDVKKEYVPVAYGLLAVGAYFVIKDPKRIFSLISAYMMWQSIVEKGKQTVSSLNP